MALASILASGLVLAGCGGKAGALGATPTRVDLGEIPFGGRPSLGGVTVSNRAASPVLIRFLRIDGDTPAQVVPRASTCAAGKRLAAGGSCTVVVSVQADRYGSIAGRLVVGYGDRGSPLTVPVAATGGGRPVLRILTPRLEFGAHGAAGRPASAPIVLASRGTAAVSVDEDTIEGADASSFTIDAAAADCSLSRIAPGATCHLPILFHPATAARERAVLVLTTRARDPGGDWHARTIRVPLAGGGSGRPAAAPTHPQIRVGGFPTGIALNPATGTVYVGNGTSGTVSVIDGNTCNAGRTSGCGQQVAAVTAGFDPIGVAVDQATNTVYVVNFSGSVAVVDGSRCDAADRSGCRRRPVTVQTGPNPQFLAVDEKTDTIYVANGASNTVSVIDGRTCNGKTTTGCARPLGSAPVGPGPFALVVNDVTSSIYVTNLGAHTVSVIDGKTCNATNVRGCRRRPVTVNVGEEPGGIAVDTRTNTIYVTGESSDDVSVIDGKTCNARVTSGCRRTPVHVLAGAGARGIAVNEVTDTVYVANTAANTVSVIDGSTCNATVQTGCGRPARVTPVGVSPRRIAIDEATNTIYVTNAESNTVSMLDGRTCNGRVHTGCGRATTPA